MVTKFEELVALCDEELRHREYSDKYYGRIVKQWCKLREWLEKNNISEFNEAVGINYCDEMLGTHLMLSNMPVSLREKLRAVRMLISYQASGDFEFRCPKVEYIFKGIIGEAALEYLNYCQHVLKLANTTIENKRLYLFNFCTYVEVNGVEIENISVENIENFFSSMNYSLASRHNSSKTIKQFLRFIFDQGKTKKDTSVFVLPDNYSKNCKLPTTYEEDEIKKIISSVERASAIGKRDYLILLLATEYGWRASDITKFSFNDIDWDKNEISFQQQKTDIPVVFPLLATVGNAIIDYLKHARPNTDSTSIIVSHDPTNKGKPISSPTIHSIVTKYIKRAEIKDWRNKKHGPHAMRHSLATNLLKKNVSMPIISTVMGHQRTETTSIYISVDFNKLKQCALPMPKLHSPFYGKQENSYAKV